jgi:hypothetical protein
MSTNSTHQLSKTSNAPGDVHTNILRKLRNKCKTRTIFGQQTKEARQHISFKSSNQHLEANFNNIFKENRRYFTSRTNTFISYKASRQKKKKRPQAWSSQFQLMYVSRKVEIDHFLLYLVRQNVTIRTSPDLFEINNNEAPNEEIWRHKLYHSL